MAAARRLVLISLLAASARLMLAEDTENDDVDRTDFSDSATSEDNVHPLGASTEVEHVSMMPDLATPGKVPAGVDSVLLVALSNLGPRMYNVTDIDGYLVDVASSKKVELLKKRTYGESLKPHEQGTYRYAFAPSDERKLGEYRFIFSAYYTNKEKEPFVSVVFNETAELVAAPLSDEHLKIMYAAAAGAVLLVVIIAKLFSGGKAKSTEATSSKASKAAAKDSSGADEWLKNTSASSEGKSKKAKRG
mmetsp:Transcript_9323/g.20331  ORF Transcript_9323/g.20331 Transcript_9323/m.20331 type:complete len:248 (-) Transcript_9323:211-954(-)|eukprot:CAMPEP_0183351540 /NCGR_PEP_ID=MMETSP0164_2-20130417/25608_1 /TAXON_ID=221442 /ORGANISM="Coccolithus pelagicus ssp braarudi, Strain PLY182g" /LENGTH=247 /DNA_ID=CAMNT_0025523743 /DNA_START=41 /DNA_END=784 /DNA_ORIENTATION=+